jgi:hypothetical protein
MSDNENKRSSRASEEFKVDRNKPWAPPSSLDAPPAPDGYVHRWIRVESMGFQDTANVSKKMREGWEFVRAEEIVSKFGKNQYPVIHDGKYAGLIGVAGLVLARIPEEIVKSRAEYFRKVTQDRINAIDSDLMKEQRPEMPININRQSRVTFGGGNKK